MADYYSILGVPRDASDDDIKRAYRKLAQQYHPDRAGGNEQKFKEINEAYQVLSDKAKRQQYDQFGTTFEQGAGAGGGFGGFGGAEGFGGFEGAFRNGGAEFNFGNFGFEDIFSDIFGGGRGERGGGMRKGEDINIDIEITLEDVLHGAEKELSLYKRVICSHCGGSGAEPGTKIKDCPTCKGSGQIRKSRRTILGTFSQVTVCPDCKGEGKKAEKACRVCGGDGRVRDTRNIKIHVPPGIQDGQIIEIQGEGEAATKGGVSGDLYIAIHVKNHPNFKRHNSNIIYQAEIPVSIAVLGGEIEIPTLEGKVKLKIPAGTKQGKVLSLKNKGLPNFRRSGRGDELVEIMIKIPEKLSRHQRELFEQLGKEGL